MPAKPERPRNWDWRSWVALRLVQRGAMAALLVLAGATLPSRQQQADTAAATFVRETQQRWCQAYGRRDDLQAVVVDVRYRAEPPLFNQSEGIVVAPVAIGLPGAQRVLEVASRPLHLRKLAAGGITALAWEYAGRVHRPLRFTGMALVERRPATAVPRLENPGFSNMPADLRAEATATASALEEHGLHKCAAFPEWARRTAGDPPYPDQVLRLVRAVSARPKERQEDAEDVCAALREGHLTSHWAQVAAVMGARELGIPAFAFVEAAPRRAHLVGTYTDREGWIVVDVDRPGDGFRVGGAPLVTMSPLLAEFAASQHDFWYPQAAAYAAEGWGGGVSSVSTTEWRDGGAADPKPTDTTEARAARLSEVCR